MKSALALAVTGPPWPNPLGDRKMSRHTTHDPARICWRRFIKSGPTLRLPTQSSSGANPVSLSSHHPRAASSLVRGRGMGLSLPGWNR